tara:strand:+ start:67 stop:903 length:837 start_codon:yes stop_codon:yes gene_type:complete
MYKILKLTVLSLALATIVVSCSNENKENDLEANEYSPRFNEFMACEKGTEYSAENLSNMISDWRAFQLSEELMGAFFHDPINEENTFGPTAWWELEWSSKEAADAAWEQWSNNEEALEWSEKYLNVVVCDQEGRNSWDLIYPITVDFFGKPNDSGYFYSQYWSCNYKNDANREDMENFIPTHKAFIERSDLQGTGYHYGVYFDRRSEDASHSNVETSHLWAEWARSAESMDVQNRNFADNGQSTFEIFNQIGACPENPDIYDSWVLYLKEKPEIVPSF